MKVCLEHENIGLKSKKKEKQSIYFPIIINFFFMFSLMQT